MSTTDTPSAVTGRVAGKLVVVTGAAGGQGAAAAIALHREGATVVATDRECAPGTALAAALSDRLRYQQLDVADEEDWARLASQLRSMHGRVDGLVNNAGVTLRARLLEVTAAELAGVNAVNLTGPLLGIQHLSPLMHAGASIINIGSVAALTGHFPVAYTTSKWGLRGLTRIACTELGQQGIRVNLVHPGYIETPMTASASAAFRDANIAETPLGRTGTPEEVAPLIVFLISDESSFISGAEIAVDGGLTAHGGVKSISDTVRAGGTT